MVLSLIQEMSALLDMVLKAFILSLQYFGVAFPGSTKSKRI